MATPKEFGAGSVNAHRRAKRLAQGMPAGRAGVSPVRRGGALSQADEGQKEVYVEPWDDSLADRGFDFVTFDPAGIFT